MTSIAYENLRRAQPELNLPRWVNLNRTGKRKMRLMTAEAISAKNVWCKMADRAPWWKINWKVVIAAGRVSSRDYRAAVDRARELAGLPDIV